MNKEFQALLANEADYDESKSAEYVGTILDACLQRLGIGLINDVDFESDQYILKLGLQNVQALVKQRPAAQVRGQCPEVMHWPACLQALACMHLPASTVCQPPSQ